MLWHARPRFSTGSKGAALTCGPGRGSFARGFCKVEGVRTCVRIATCGMLAEMLSTTPSNRDFLFTPLPQFKSTWPAGGWSWDNRFECLASTISQGSAADGFRAVQALFPHVWDEKTVRTAPPSVAKVSTETGGVRAGQFLFSSDAMDGLLVYGLWWPWGEEGTSISMRIGLAGAPTQADLLKLRSAFNVSDY